MYGFCDAKEEHNALLTVGMICDYLLSSDKRPAGLGAGPLLAAGCCSHRKQAAMCGGALPAEDHD